MKETQAKTGKFALNFGVILAVIYLVFNGMLYSMDLHYSRDTTIQIVVILAMVGVVIWAIINFRKANHGFLKIKEALKIGAGIALIAGIAVVLYTIVLSNFLDLDFIKNTAEIQREASIASGHMSNEQIQQQYDGTIDYFWMSYPVIIIAYIIFGLICGLIGGLILKKQNPSN